jgi:hypothetical protein
MWRARFKQQGTNDQWLWTTHASPSAREATQLARSIASGKNRDLLDARGRSVCSSQADHSHPFYVVPAEDLGYAPRLARPVA